MVRAHLDYGYTLKQIALALGIHYTTVSRAIKRSKCYIARPDPELSI